MNEIICTTQAELDAVPVDYDGRVIVKFGTTYNRAKIKQRFKYPVLLRGNSHGVLMDNSTADGAGNAQIVDCVRKNNAKVNGNARIVYNPYSIDEYIDFYGLDATENTVRLFKAVHFNGKKYYADADHDFIYTIGDMAVPANGFDDNVKMTCGAGIHLAHKAWAINYGNGWNDLAILELECEKADVLVPLMSDGKVRARKAKVIREVPLEECGLYGAMLAKQRANK